MYFKIWLHTKILPYWHIFMYFIICFYAFFYVIFLSFNFEYMYFNILSYFYNLIVLFIFSIFLLYFTKMIFYWKDPVIPHFIGILISKIPFCLMKWHALFKFSFLFIFSSKIFSNIPSMLQIFWKRSSG